MINWNDYLHSLCNDYAQWWNTYTLTDVVGQQRIEQKHSPLLLDFMVQTVQSAQEERSASQEKVERLDVLAGLRKYAQEHVLLVGRPGSGKSTALARLLLEEAKKPLPQPLSEAERGASSPPSLPEVDRGVNSPPSLAGKGVGGLGQIPILVELRYYQTSVLDLIRDFLKRHRLLLETATIEQLLCQGQFLLLVDGINELPSEKARQDLYKFRQDYQKTTPMIFTTRDLGVGGDLGITKKLEMQPLTAEQMQQFVRAYLPQQGEQMLQNLGDRLREFGETPLLLLMLCSLFQATGDIPPNLGLVFRQFTQSYERQFRQDIPVTDESRRWWFSLLKHLAFYMTTGDKLTELNVAIPKSKAEDVLTQFLQAEKFDRPRDRALEWLQDLLNHHLIQLGANDQIEFRHQLIQEYYTAECLLKQLPNLSDDCLQREYLNYLKWTEPLKLMLELVDDGAQAVRVVNLALKVDWQLGAKLAGAVKQELQQPTVDLVAGLEIPLLFKIRLLGLTKSDKAIPYLIQLLEDGNSDVLYSAASALGEIKSDAAIPGLIKLLEHEKSSVRSRAAKALEEIKSGVVISKLNKLSTHQNKLSTHQNFDELYHAVSELEKIKSEAVISELIKLLEHEKSSVRSSVASALGGIKSETAIPKLIKLLKDKNSYVRSSAADALGKINSETAVPELIKLLGHEDSDTRSSAADALGKIKSKTVIPVLIKLLEDKNYYVRYSAAKSLGKIKSEAAIPVLIKLLEDEYSFVRSRAASALGEIKSEAAILGLIKLLEEKNFYVRYSAAEALGQIKSEQSIPALIKLLEHEESYVCYSAAFALKQINVEMAIPKLIKLLEDKKSTVRSSAAKVLGEIKSEAAIPGLIKLLEDKDSSVRSSAASALGEIKSEVAIPGLIKLLEHEEFVSANNGDTLPYALQALEAIQENCQYYNCLTESKSQHNCLTESKSQPDTPPSQPIKTSLMYILHLSDLHFGTPDQAKLWSNQLASDLQNELGIPQLDALILSGDIANKSTPNEYAAAQQFLDELRQDFRLKPEQIIIVPGNHDLNWQISEEEGYIPTLRKKYQGSMDESCVIDDGGNYIAVLDPENHKRRFEHFSKFYQAIKNQPYPLEYEKQYTLDYFPNQNLLILGLNSAWQLDHHYKSRASINMNALTNALKEIRRQQNYQNCRKIAVWHHPLDSAWEDRIKDQSFMEQLAVAGFRFFLHGHVHKAETSLYRYDMSANGRKLDRICAGTFGAPTHELNPGYPWQYNLLKFVDNQLTVYTRRREELNGAWKPDARWLMGAGQNPLPYYEVQL
ncbi:MAG TPA: HEAT repeat domain-containing protein [Trichormus sp. M33_DOE_039]|nr:HEAT repeat domain-containing protein [Trichormus sp. M33_DOE_039]